MQVLARLEFLARTRSSDTPEQALLAVDGLLKQVNSKLGLVITYVYLRLVRRAQVTNFKRLQDLACHQRAVCVCVFDGHPRQPGRSTFTLRFAAANQVRPLTASNLDDLGPG